MSVFKFILIPQNYTRYLRRIQTEKSYRSNVRRRILTLSLEKAWYPPLSHTQISSKRLLLSWGTFALVTTGGGETESEDQVQGESFATWASRSKH